MEAPGNREPDAGIQVELNNNSVEKRSKHLPPKLMSHSEWPLWKLKMRLHFESNAVWDIVNGERPPPADDAPPEVLERYQKQKSLAHSDLLKCLGPSFEALAATYENAALVWQCLRDVCQTSLSAQLLEVQEKIQQLQTSQPLTTCLLDLKKLVRELIQKGGQMSSGQQALRLIQLLPPSFSETVKNIQLEDRYKLRLPNGNLTEELDFDAVFNYVYRRALLEKSDSNEAPTKTVMFTEREETYRNPQGRQVCKNCRERGHHISRCERCYLCLGPHRTYNCWYLTSARDLVPDSARFAAPSEQRAKPTAPSRPAFSRRQPSHRTANRGSAPNRDQHALSISSNSPGTNPETTGKQADDAVTGAQCFVTLHKYQKVHGLDGKSENPRLPGDQNDFATGRAKKFDRSIAGRVTPRQLSGTNSKNMGL